MLFAWPLVVAIGALLNWWVGSPAPMSSLPMAWLLSLAWLIERMTITNDQ
jgi:hypothetical protein